MYLYAAVQNFVCRLLFRRPHSWTVPHALCASRQSESIIQGRFGDSSPTGPSPAPDAPSRQRESPASRNKTLHSTNHNRGRETESKTIEATGSRRGRTARLGSERDRVLFSFLSSHAPLLWGCMKISKRLRDNLPQSHCTFRHITYGESIYSPWGGRHGGEVDARTESHT